MDVVLLTGLIIILCIIASKITGRWGVPALLVFIVLGMLFGSDGIVKIPMDDYGLVEQICSVLLSLIMFYGGFCTSWKHAKPVAGKAVLLSTLGVVITALVTAVFCRFILEFGYLESFLIGSVISSTDAASVFSILRAKKLNLKDNTASLLEMESGSNDPASYLLTIAALQLMSETAGGELLITLFLQIVVGVAMGCLAAFTGMWVLKNKRLAVEGHNALFVLALTLVTYTATSFLSGNGYLAVYLFGIILGNSSIRDKAPLVHFFDGTTSQAQIVIFFLLGLLSYPSHLPGVFPQSLAIALCLTFIARPIAVFSILSFMGCPRNQKLLVSFAGVRGAASIVFAIIALGSGADIRWDLFHIVFCVCLLSVSFQGTLLPLVARKLDMVDDRENVMKTFNDYQLSQQMQLIKSHVPAGHPWIGKTISELPGTINVLIVMIIRGEQSIVPRGDTVILPEDLLVFCGEPYFDETEPSLEEVPLREGHAWIGQRIQHLPLSDKELVVLIQHSDNGITIPHGDTLLKAGDTLVMRTIRD